MSEIEAPQSGPWADDIRNALGEEFAGAFDVIDGYMRENVQPRITQLEQDPGRELWADLEKDPDQAILDLVAARYGDEIVDSYRGLFGSDEPAAEATPPAETTPPAEATGLSQEDQELLAWAREKREGEQKQARDTEYQEFKQELAQKHGLTEKDVALLDPFIYANASDPDAAVSAYKAWQAEAGVPVVPEAVVPEPPAVLGDDASTAATPPVAPQYTKFNQLEDALGDWLSTQGPSSTPPPVVG